MNLRMTPGESNQMLPMRASLAALALVFSLVGALAAEQAEAGSSVPQRRHAVVADEQVNSESEKAGFISGLPSYGLVSFCVGLLFGIAYMVRQLNNANRQFERRTLDLSRSNEQLKN